LGEAAKYAKTTPEIYQTAIEPLKNQLRRGIVELIPNVTVDGDQTNCLPNIVNLSFAGVEGESITLSLDDVGIAVSTGSACATGDIKPSHVLMAIKANPELAHGSIRFSLGLNTTESDINYVLAKLPATIGQLRQISTVKIKGRK
ncbi:MAG: aminotransferase class V-fold PLP-dependent enzyme, partial [Candidatus Nomurabacteria bacterium]|jgi:cysteine desulfurase|nr:aminotransferase class V-fold PLP-dependent enzyme [Candidatus Nomurabacteria bacterium]